MPINRHFDLIAPHYDRLIGGEGASPERQERLQAYLVKLESLLLPDLPADRSAPANRFAPAPGWMLDAAGGTGRLARHLAPLVEQMVVCDLSMPMLRQAASRVDFLTRARAELLPFPDGFFTRILVVDALHHFSAQAGAIRDLSRVLAPGGRLVIQDLDIRSGWVKAAAVIENLLLMGSRFRTAQWIAGQMAQNGLRAEAEVEHGTAWVVGVK